MIELNYTHKFILNENEIRKILNEKKILCFDIDGIICKSYKGNYKKSKPILKNISLINNYFKEGHFIKIFTSVSKSS